MLLLLKEVDPNTSLLPTHLILKFQFPFLAQAVLQCTRYAFGGLLAET